MFEDYRIVKEHLWWNVKWCAKYKIDYNKKNLQTVNAGEGVEKREPSYTVGGNVNWYSHYGE